MRNGLGTATKVNGNHDQTHCTTINEMQSQLRIAEQLDEDPHRSHYRLHVNGRMHE